MHLLNFKTQNLPTFHAVRRLVAITIISFPHSYLSKKALLFRNKTHVLK